MGRRRPAGGQGRRYRRRRDPFDPAPRGQPNPWHLQIGNVVFPKSVTPARIEENADVFDFNLSETELAQVAELDRGGRIGPDPNTFVRP